MQERFYHYNKSFVYCRELAVGTANLTTAWVRGDDRNNIGIIVRETDR